MTKEDVTKASIKKVDSSGGSVRLVTKQSTVPFKIHTGSAVEEDQHSAK